MSRGFEPEQWPLRQAMMALYRADWDGEACYPERFVPASVADELLARGWSERVDTPNAGYRITHAGKVAWADLSRGYLASGARDLNSNLIKSLFNYLPEESMSETKGTRSLADTRCPKCGQPRMVCNDKGGLHPLCAEHMKEKWREKKQANRDRKFERQSAVATVVSTTPPDRVPAQICPEPATAASRCETCEARELLEMLQAQSPTVRELIELYKRQRELLDKLK